MCDIVLCAPAGVEYIISRRLYEGLPEYEKRFWHSHVYEVSMHCHAAGMMLCSM